MIIVVRPRIHTRTLYNSCAWAHLGRGKNAFFHRLLNTITHTPPAHSRREPERFGRGICFSALNPCQIVGRNALPRLFSNNNEYNKEFVFPVSDALYARTDARLFPHPGRVDLPAFVSQTAFAVLISYPRGVVLLRFSCPPPALDRVRTDFLDVSFAYKKRATISNHHVQCTSR